MKLLVLSLALITVSGCLESAQEAPSSSIESAPASRTISPILEPETERETVTGPSHLTPGLYVMSEVFEENAYQRATRITLEATWEVNEAGEILLSERAGSCERDARVTIHENMMYEGKEQTVIEQTQEACIPRCTDYFETYNPETGYSNTTEFKCVSLTRLTGYYNGPVRFENTENGFKVIRQSAYHTDFSTIYFERAE